MKLFNVTPLDILMQYESNDACYYIGQVYFAFIFGNFPCKVCRPSHHHHHPTNILLTKTFPSEVFIDISHGRRLGWAGKASLLGAAVARRKYGFRNCCRDDGDTTMYSHLLCRDSDGERCINISFRSNLTLFSRKVPRDMDDFKEATELFKYKACCYKIMSTEYVLLSTYSIVIHYLHS